MDARAGCHHLPHMSDTHRTQAKSTPQLASELRWRSQICNSDGFTATDIAAFISKRCASALSCAKMKENSFHFPLQGPRGAPRRWRRHWQTHCWTPCNWSALGAVPTRRNEIMIHFRSLSVSSARTQAMEAALTDTLLEAARLICIQGTMMSRQPLVSVTHRLLPSTVLAAPARTIRACGLGF